MMQNKYSSSSNLILNPISNTDFIKVNLLDSGHQNSKIIILTNLKTIEIS